MSSGSSRKTGTSRLWELALTRKRLALTACALSVVGCAVSFIPFLAVYALCRDLLAAARSGSEVPPGIFAYWGWIACGTATGAVLLHFAALACSHLAAFQTLYILKLDFSRQLASLPLGYHTANATGKLRKIIDENIEKLELFIAHQLPDLAGSMAAPVVIFGILLFFDWRLGLASLLPVIIAYAALSLGYGRKTARDLAMAYQDHLEEMNSAAVEYVRGISVIKAFNQSIFSFRTFHETIRAHKDFCWALATCFKTPMGILLVCINNVYLFVLPPAIWLSGSVTDLPGFLLSVFFYLIFSLSIPGPFLKLLYMSGDMKQVAEGVRRMDAVFAEKPLPEPRNPKTAERYDIVFDDVSFHYEPPASGECLPEFEPRDAVSHVSFTVPAGSMTALVGPSGSGKSTVAALLPRFYDVSGGSIRIGGVDVREMASDYLLSRVSFVFQEVFLFKQSVADNILVGRPDASREDVVRAARAARCHEFVERLPDGYDTVVGVEGVHLSSGEKQRLAIARAIIKDAPILVLDEATAFADPENEYHIQQALKVLMRGKTVVMIAHRLSTVTGADNIVVLDGGQVAEQGAHAELLAKNGRYARMWEHYRTTLDWHI